MMIQKTSVFPAPRDAEDLAQAADAVGLEHLNIHAFGDAVFDPVFADIEPVIGEASVPDPLVMILDIPFFCDAEAVRQQIKDADDPPEEVPPARKPMVDRLDDLRIGHVKCFQLQAHGDYGIDMGRVRGGINAVRPESVRGVHLPKPRFISRGLCIDLPAMSERQCFSVHFAVFPDGFLHQCFHLPMSSVIHFRCLWA